MPADAEQIARLDEVVVDEIGLPLVAMMEHAGRHLADVAAQVGDGAVVVLAGKGHNGGGGLCAARHLANMGREVACVQPYDPDEVADATAMQRRVADAAGVHARSRVGRAGLIVDALLGYRARGAPRPPLDGLVEQANDADATRVSLDLPTGLDATSGEAPGPVVHADVTVTLAVAKVGLLRGRGPAVAGRVVVADIGIPRVAYERVGLERPGFGADGRVDG